MAARSFSYLFFFVFLFVPYLIVNQYQSAPVIKNLDLDPNDLFPQAKKSVSLINRSENIGKSFCLNNGYDTNERH